VETASSQYGYGACGRKRFAVLPVDFVSALMLVQIFGVWSY
jgi:hypothetical protein